MSEGPNIAQVGALVGDPARAAMLTALLGGRALTAGELARHAGVTPQTASGHLARLEDGGLLARETQGRHRYFRLASPEAAALVESLGVFVARAEADVRTGPRDPALRRARVCYDHLAGEVAVGLLDALVAGGAIDRRDDSLVLTRTGRARLEAFGIDLDAADRERRPLCRACLDWSVRRHHLAGALGAAMLSRLVVLGWLRRTEGSRVLVPSPAGLAGLRGSFGLPL